MIISCKVYVVTGANEGIGYGIVRGLAKQLQGAVIYLTAKDLSLAELALRKLCEELGPKKGRNELRYHRLDITSEVSCRALAEQLSREHGGLDVLINNAGFAFKQFAKEPPGVQADITIRINYYGTRQITEALIPLIRKGGRIVNVCSQAGMMTGRYDQEHIDMFSRRGFSLEDIDDFVEGYKRLAHENIRKEGGYVESAYCVSKTAEIALSVYYARQLKKRKITVHPCCPGYVCTQMTSYKGRLTIDQGAITPIWLATEEKPTPSGVFVYQKKAKNWINGKVDLYS